MRKFSTEGKLVPEVIESILSEEKPNQKEKISIKMETARKYMINLPKVGLSVAVSHIGFLIMSAHFGFLYTGMIRIA